MAVTLSGNCKYFTLQVGVYDTVLETFVPTSEVQTVDYLQECTRNTIYLTWLNSLACWEYWAFNGESEKGFDIDNSQIAQNNVYENWDINFANAETEEFYHFVEAYEQRLVRSQRLTPEQGFAISKIKVAIQAQEIQLDLSKRTVMVDKTGGFFKRDNSKGTELSFRIKGTSKMPIQGQ